MSKVRLLSISLYNTYLEIFHTTHVQVATMTGLETDDHLATSNVVEGRGAAFLHIVYALYNLGTALECACE